MHVKNHYSGEELVRVQRAIKMGKRKREKEREGWREVRLRRNENNILFLVKSISDGVRGLSVRTVRYIEALSQTVATERR